jgi:hypothetical protein
MVSPSKLHQTRQSTSSLGQRLAPTGDFSGEQPTEKQQQRTLASFFERIQRESTFVVALDNTNGSLARAMASILNAQNESADASVLLRSDFRSNRILANASRSALALLVTCPFTINHRSNELLDSGSRQHSSSTSARRRLNELPPEARRAGIITMEAMRHLLSGGPDLQGEYRAQPNTLRVAIFGPRSRAIRQQLDHFQAIGYSIKRLGSVPSAMSSPDKMELLEFSKLPSNSTVTKSH